MGMGRSLAFACALICVLCPSARGDDKLAAELKFFGITVERDADGKIAKVVLPSGARDYHLELILDNPAVAKNVAEIRAPKCRASFKRVKELANLPALTAVDFEGVDNANDYVASLCTVRTLQKLSLPRSSLTNSGLEDICKSHPKLRELDVSGTKVTIEHAIPMILDLRAIETLRLLNVNREWQREYPSSNEPVQFGRLADLPRLTSLSASGFEVTTEQVLPFACICHLAYFFVDDLRTDVETLIYLHECQPQLQLGPKIASGLRIPFTGREYVASIQSCPYPRFLRMPRRLLTHLEDVDIVAATNFDFLEWTPALKHLQLYGLHITRDELSRLAKAPNVETLTIFRAKIDAATVDVLLAVPSLRQFSFRACEIDADASAKIRAHAGNGRIQVSRF